MPTIFISHATSDRAFALRLARSLEQLGHRVWIDLHEIGVGDSIPCSLEQAIDQADYLVVVLSKHTANSSWSEREWQAKYWQEVGLRQQLVLPVVIDDCTIPFFLRPKRHADFRAEYAVGLAQLAVVLHEQKTRQLEIVSVSSNQSENGVDRAHKHVVSQKSVICYPDRSMSNLGKVTEVNVELAIPYIGKIAGVWKPDEEEQEAAWEMYIELATRISVAQLPPNVGLLRESLSSLYGIFTTTRQILRKHGPSVARPKENGQVSFGYLAIGILNCVLLPR